MCYFVSYLGERNLSHSTIKSYLAAIRNLHIDYGFPSPFDTKIPRLDMVLRGIKISLAKKGKAPKRKLLITPKILRQVKSTWNGINKCYEETMLWAASVVCFFGFMRAGELLVSSRESFDPSKHLTLEDIATDSKQSPSFIQISPKTSKTDPFGRGVDITIGRTSDDLCPVEAMFNYLQWRGPDNGPLFIKQDGAPLTKPVFIGRLQRALEQIGYRDCQQYSGHSFRAGAATTAAAMKVEDSIIKTLGRWESTAYLLYIRIPREELKGVSQELTRFGK